MKKYIRALEIPIYLLVIAMSCFERGSQPIGFILVLVSVVRLIVNVTTDEFIYKK